MSAPVAGEINITVLPSTTQDERTVDVVVAGVRELFGVAYELRYPNDKVEIASVQPGSLWDSETLFFSKDNASTGVLGIGASLKDRNQSRNGNGQIARIRMKAKPGVELTDDLQLALDEIVAVNRNGEIVRIENGTPTHIEEPPTTPNEFQLYKNYPNPFNPSTTIRYAVPRGSHVKLLIYDVNGHLVRKLVNSNQPAGFHEIRWDGRNQAGLQVPSGVYHYRVTAGSHSTTRKMLLVR